MSALDSIAPNYQRAQQRWPNAPTLAGCYSALKTPYETNSHGLVEHVKSFIESVCLTIMTELSEPVPSSTPTTTDLLVAALSPLGLRNTRGANKLDKVLSGFNKLTDALSEMRNANGPIAHGKDAFLDALTADHARAFLHTGDAILGVLLHRLDGRQPDLNVTREPYESFPHLNERIDRAISVDVRVDEDDERPMIVFSVATGPREEAIELRVEPSRLLYGIDRSAYIEVLETAIALPDDPEDVDASTEAEDLLEQEASSGPKSIPLPTPLDEIFHSYQRNLEPLRQSLTDFLTAEGLGPSFLAGESSKLTDSLLASAAQNMVLDWKRRESFQARLKVALRRVLIKFKIAPKHAEQVAEHLVAWLRVQTPDADGSCRSHSAASG